MIKYDKVYICDECKHKWVAEVEKPERCPSRKCRKRSWDKLGLRVGFPEIPKNNFEKPANRQGCMCPEVDRRRGKHNPKCPFK